MNKRRFLNVFVKIFVNVFIIISCSLSSVNVFAQENEYNEEDISKTAYVDMSRVGPLQLHFIEDNFTRRPDYYYAAYAFNILHEKATMDSMYQQCTQIVVTIDSVYNSTEFILTNTTCEPKVQTGYLNLLSNSENKYYTIDNVLIQIQR